MSFQNVFKNPITKTWGGTNKGTADPFISGYFGVYFADMPESINNLSNINAADQNPTAGASTTKVGASSLLSATCISINVPGITLNKTTFNGIGTKKWAVPTNTDIGDSISLRFIEFSGLPISKLFYQWVNTIRSTRHQASKLTNGTYTKSAYSCSIYYWITNPAMTKDDIEVAYCFTGCFPSKIPTDNFNSDVNTNDKLEIDMDFNVDEVFCSLDPEQDWVKTKCQALIDTLGWEKSKQDFIKGVFGGPSSTNDSQKKTPFVSPQAITKI